MNRQMKWIQIMPVANLPDKINDEVVFEEELGTPVPDAHDGENEAPRFGKTRSVNKELLHLFSGRLKLQS